MERRNWEGRTRSMMRWLFARKPLPLFCVGITIAALLVFNGIGTPQMSFGRAIELVSVSIFGTSGNDTSSGVAVNSNGNFVGFWSDATNLVLMDRNDFRDVYERNRLLPPSTQRISLNSAGVAANAPSHAQGGAPAVNGDGQLVAFYSNATNLVPTDTNGLADVFLRIVQTGMTELISVNSANEQGNGPSLYPSISADGRFVAFQSAATNLVPGDTNGMIDIFVRDRQSGTTERLCNTTQGNGFAVTPAISADGNVVAFASSSTHLIPMDTNGQIDVFVCDRRTQTIDVVSINDDGELGNGDSILPAINLDGTLVAFKSIADNLVPNDRNGVVDVFARDRTAMHTERISVNFNGGDANEGSFPPSVDYSGRFVAFGSAANNLVPNDFSTVANVFVRDRMQNLTLMVDVNERGEQANNSTADIPPSVSGDAKQIGFVSLASNLTPNDGNGHLDVFITRNPFICENDEDCPPGFMCEDGMCVMRGTPTPTPTANAEDCCQCGEACEDPSDMGCPVECDIVRQAACIDGMNCATFTPTQGGTPTPTPGPEDCCQCTGPACEEPSNQGCPNDCTLVRQAECLTSGNCATFTPTPTPGPDDCCQCPGPACQEPSSEGCPDDCTLTRQAECLTSGNCATFTPTPTANPNDCCECPDDMCEGAGNDGCPPTCGIVRQAACLGGVECVTFTPTPTGGTPTPTPTAGPFDCCECPNNRCEAPGGDGCPTSCEIIRSAACIGNACATFTPTPTAGPRDCCQCTVDRCQAPGLNGCPMECEIIRDAVCVNSADCATFTATPSPTPTGGTATLTPTSGGTNTPTAQPTGPQTGTPTQTGGTATPTSANRPDKDACNCKMTPENPNPPLQVPYWLAVPAALLILRRRHLR